MMTAQVIPFPRGVTPEAVILLVERIRPILENQVFPLLKGHPPEMQGCVLADLLAIWLAGHHVAGDEDATRMCWRCTAGRCASSPRSMRR